MHPRRTSPGHRSSPLRIALARLRSGLLVVVPAAFLLAWHPPGTDDGRPEARPANPVLVDNFESYRVEGLPTKWKFVGKGQELVPISEELMSKEEYFVVQREGGNKFLRAVTKDRAHRLILMNEHLGGWRLSDHPHLRWDWRAHRLPQGAREDSEKTNDTGAAIYVTFSRDWLGRPKSIKYTYSSTLPVGTVVDYGRLQVIVVSSANDGIGRWKTIERDVVADYRRVFGGDPPDKPVSVMLWSDSNTMHDVAEVDFDNIMLAAAPDGTM